jgi:hypothetical protein
MPPQEQIDKMLDACIDSIVDPRKNPLSELEVQTRGYGPLIEDFAEEKGQRLLLTLNGAAAVLEAASQLGIVSKPEHIGFIQRHELLLHIDASLPALAHLNRPIYESLRETWFNKTFHEKETIIEGMPGAKELKRQLAAQMEMLLTTLPLVGRETDVKAKAALTRIVNKSHAEIARLHRKFASSFKDEVTKDVKYLTPEAAIIKLLLAGGRAGRKYAAAYTERLRRLAKPPATHAPRSRAKRALPTAMPRPRRRRFGRPGR